MTKKLPQPIDYQQAVQRPDIAFVDEVLKQGKPRWTPLGNPWAATGGFALTFDITAPEERFAVRCFHRHGNQLQERYEHIAKFVGENRDLMFLVDVRYLKDGIQVEGRPQPIVRMPWVRGVPLNAWVEDNLHNAKALRQVRDQVSQAVQWMRRRGAAHGDLQHGNILVGEQNTIRLVDYDGMFLPSLRAFGAAENGHRNYQHPDRDNHYDESLDLFAAQVIDLSLAALERKPALWEEFNTDQNLLFSADDFVEPGSSTLFPQLWSLPELAEPTRQLISACEADFGSVPDVLLGGVGKRQKQSPSSGRRGANRPPRFLGNERPALLEREGDEVTITGLIVACRTVTGRDKAPVTFLNFGDFRRGDPALVAFGRSSRELCEQFGSDLADLKNAWVSMTGFVHIFNSPKWGSSPQIEVQRVRSLHLLTPVEVEEILTENHDPAPSEAGAEAEQDPGEPDRGGKVGGGVDSETHQKATPRDRTSSQPTPNPQVQTGKGTTQEYLDQQISNLYSSPRFAQSGTESSAPSRPAPPKKSSQGIRRPSSGSGAQSSGTGGSSSSSAHSFSTSPKNSGSPPSARQTPAPKSRSGGAAASSSSSQWAPLSTVSSSVVSSTQRRGSWREVVLGWFRRK